ncbi:MAG: matrixin family metalloprotease [Bacteroidota bacterium]
MRKICIILTSFLLFACDNSPKMESKIIPLTIDIQPFSDATTEQVKFVYNELHKIYPNIIIKKAIDLPAFAYYKPRNRYRADSLVGYLNRRTEQGHITMALTNKDISWTKGTIKDYGIMGLGLCPGNSCVASTFRLSKTNTLDQLFKIAIHELGHTQGLPHCSVKTCFMRDAEGKNHTNELNAFCENCRKHLISKGWVLT